jgi:hypothetical protein
MRFVIDRFFASGIFEDLTLPDAHDQLIVSFLNSPSLIYGSAALAQLSCYELKLHRTNPTIPIDFFRHAISIEHLIIDNPSFRGFLPSLDRQSTWTPIIHRLTIRDIAVGHLQKKHFPIVFDSVHSLVLQNYHIRRAFRSWNNNDLAQRFPQLRSLQLFSVSIDRLHTRMFEGFDRLESLHVDGIRHVENEAFAHLHHLKRLDLGKDLRRLDPFAFVHMFTELLLINRSDGFELNDDVHFCTFAQFSPSIDRPTFVRFAERSHQCSCTVRYLYRHLDKSHMPLTPNCYSNASVYILTQEERICHFDQRLSQCDVLPNGGVTIYGRQYNASDLQRQQRTNLLALYGSRLYYLLLLIICAIILCWAFRQQKVSYRHLERLLKRQTHLHENNAIATTTTTTPAMIYHSSSEQIDRISVRTTKV